MSDDEDIGFRKPPKHSRWKKGQSGNPKGRAKGQRNLKTDLLAELHERIQINEGGIPRRITKQRALLKAIIVRAIAGDARATAEILNLVLRLLEPEADAPPGSTQARTPIDQAILDAYLASHGVKREQSDEQ
jgi:hypothetical protein